MIGSKSKSKSSQTILSIDFDNDLDFDSILSKLSRIGMTSPFGLNRPRQLFVALMFC
jgi:hypothetical protein